MRQGQWQAIPRDLAGEGIQAQAAQAHFRLDAAQFPAPEGMHPGDQFVQVEGFDQVIVGPQIEAGNTIGHGVAGGNHQHRDVAIATAQFLQQGDAVQHGKAEIQQQHPIVAVIEGGAGGAAVPHPVHRESGQLEAARHTRADHGVVLSQQQLHG
jgi:hypothetical protein